MELDELIQELDKKLIVTKKEIVYSKKPRRLEKWIKEAKKSM